MRVSGGQWNRWWTRAAAMAIPHAGDTCPRDWRRAGPRSGYLPDSLARRPTMDRNLTSLLTLGATAAISVTLAAVAPDSAYADDFTVDANLFFRGSQPRRCPARTGGATGGRAKHRRGRMGAAAGSVAHGREHSPPAAGAGRVQGFALVRASADRRGQRGGPRFQVNRPRPRIPPPPWAAPPADGHPPGRGRLPGCLSHVQATPAGRSSLTPAARPA